MKNKERRFLWEIILSLERTHKEIKREILRQEIARIIRKILDKLKQNPIKFSKENEIYVKKYYARDFLKEIEL